MESILSVHIQKALKVVLDRPNRENLCPEIFQPSDFSPKLSHDCDNWILHYGGAFNPPHAGHLAVLSCALTNHVAGLNIIAAMIDPKDDAYLLGKNAETKETFVVTKTDRVSLWRSAESFPRSAWVFEGSECYKPIFMSELQAEAGRAGFVIKFLQVRGPDIIRPMAPPSRGTSNCDSLLIVAGTRETESFSTLFRARLRGYGPWEKVELGGFADDGGLSGTWLFKVIDQAQQILRQLIGQSQRHRAQNSRNPSWSCESESEPGWKAYFVVDLSVARGQISSTKIRRDLRSNSDNRDIADIADMALSSKMLLDLLKRGLALQSSGAQSAT
jgi:hypothetical protein